MPNAAPGADPVSGDYVESSSAQTLSNITASVGRRPGLVEMCFPDVESVMISVFGRASAA
jgi:hypothetical protein